MPFAARGTPGGWHSLGAACAWKDGTFVVLVRELSRAIGLGGRDRRAGSASERARVSVTRAVRQALARVREHHAPLADHLERVLRTGAHCSYAPDPRVPVSWTL